MMVTGHKKLASILLAAMVIVAIVVLSAAFHTLELSPEGRPLPSPERTEKEIFAPPMQPSLLPFYLYAALFILFVLLMVATITLGIISPKTRKRTITNLVVIVILIASSLALNSLPDSSEQGGIEPTVQVPLPGIAIPAGAQTAAGPPLELGATPPPWLIWGITLILALLVATGLVAIAWFSWRAIHSPSPLEQLAEEAQEALTALRAGADPKDTVLRCYLEMSRVLRKQRGIVRNQAMTAREFEMSLVAAGLPNEQVRQLTRLFELVRYGARKPAGTEEQQAIDCLTAIVEACRNLA